MSRMTREFTLILLGVCLLSAGYVIAPSAEDDLDQKLERAADRRIGREPNGQPIAFAHGIAYQKAHPNGLASIPKRSK